MSGKQGVGNSVAGKAYAGGLDDYVRHCADKLLELNISQSYKRKNGFYNKRGRLWVNNNEKFKYGLVIGDSRTPMGVFDLTPAEMYQKNAEYEDKYYRSLHTDKPKRLSRLIFINEDERARYKKACFDAAEDIKVKVGESRKRGENNG